MNVYMPAEALAEPKGRRRFLDWRFLAALAALLMIGFLVWAGFRNYEIREQEAAQKDALIEQLAARSDQIESLEGEVASLNDRIADLQDRARVDRRQAGRERARLLRQQARMLDLLRAANIDYHPAASTSYVTPAVSPGSSYNGGGGTTSAAKASASPKPAPITAGQSDKTPSGKAKGLH